MSHKRWRKRKQAPRQKRGRSSALPEDQSSGIRQFGLTMTMASHCHRFQNQHKPANLSLLELAWGLKKKDEMIIPGFRLYPGKNSYMGSHTAIPNQVRIPKYSNCNDSIDPITTAIVIMSIRTCSEMSRQLPAITATYGPSSEIVVVIISPIQSV